MELGWPTEDDVDTMTWYALARAEQPEACGYARPRIWDPYLKAWRHLADGSRCEPGERPGSSRGTW